MRIVIRMKNGPMTVKAYGRCVNTTDGAGAPYQYVDDLVCYWPGSNRVIPPNLYDIKKAEEEYWNGIMNRRE